MKIPKTLKRYCKFCKKHTLQKVSLVSSGRKRGAMKRGAIERAKKRSKGRGYGNVGRWGSKPAVTAWKRKTKSTKKTTLLYTCQECHKSTIQKKGIRVGKISLK